MRLLKKDIDKEFFKDKTMEGELEPIVFKNGVFYIPTNKGTVKIKREGKK